MDTNLEKERQVFEGQLDQWRKTHLGKYVLIKGYEVVGFFASLDAAFKEGTRLFGLAPFFIKQIVPKDKVNVSFFGKSLKSA